MLLTAIVSAFLSLLAYTNVCAEQHACLKAGTCFAASNSSFSCAFRTSITPRMEDAECERPASGARIDDARRMHARPQAECRPRHRGRGLQTTPKLPGRAEHGYCRRRRCTTESADTSAPDLPNHRRWCGRWIDARLIDMGEEKWAFFDEPDVAWDVEDVIMAKGRVGSSDVAKFRTACRSMVTANAQGAAGKLAYEYLIELNGPGVDDSIDAALATLGVLSSHRATHPSRSD